MVDAPANAPPLAAYLRKLLVFLGLVAFFVDSAVLASSQTLPERRAAFPLSPSAGSRRLAIANLETIASYLGVRLADRWGRRPLLQTCRAGYPAAALLSGVAQQPWRSR